MSQSPSPSVVHGPLTRAKIRLTKWLARTLPPKLVHRALLRRSPVPAQKIFQEGFAAADPHRTALDIGANRGLVSWYIAKRFARVHSFEPNAELADFLSKILPSNCTLHRCALSDAPGQNRLSVVLESGIPIHGKGKILAADARVDAADEAQYAVQEIKLETLDGQGIPDIGFIKIDVEGHEESVLRGGVETLKRDRPVLLIEIESRHTGKPAGETIAYVESLGYDGYFFEDGVRRPVREFREEMQTPAYPRYVNDFLFLPR